MSEKSAPVPLQLWPRTVHAGFPSPTADYSEPPLHLHDLIVENPLATYFLRVDGNSMVGAGIHPNDVIVVDRSLPAQPNQVVVVRVGKHFLLKRLVQEHPLLFQSDPPTEPPLAFREEDMELWGVVTYLVHCLVS